MPTNVIARRKSSSAPASRRSGTRRPSSRRSAQTNPNADNPGGLATGTLMVASALVGAGAMHLVSRMSKKINGSYGGYKWSITPAGGSAPVFNWNLASGGTNIAGGQASSIGGALGAIGEAIDISGS